MGNTSSFADIELSFVILNNKYRAAVFADQA